MPVTISIFSGQRSCTYIQHGILRRFAYHTPTSACVIGDTSKLKTISAFSGVKHFQKSPEITNDT